MSDIYSAVFSALDASVANNTCLASSEAQIQRALAQFRASRANRTATEQLERISVMLHELSLTSFSRDEQRRRALLDELRNASINWMNRLPVH